MGMRLLLMLVGILLGVGSIFLLFSLVAGDSSGVVQATSAVTGVFRFEEHMFEIPDECGIMLGRLLHGVKNEETCAQKCRVKCQFEGLSFEKTEFTLNQGSCNACKCYCGD